MSKNYILFITLFISFQFGFSQEYDVSYKATQVIKTRNIHLNGGFRASIGGKSRTAIKVDLPPNTIKWYYSFSTKKGKSGIQNMNLGLQLAGLLADPTGLISQATSIIKVPEGVASVDVYVCNRMNIDKFKKKVDNNGGSFSYNYEGSVENTKDGVIEIDDITSGTIFLGLKNPSTGYGVTINIEVVAIVEHKTLIEKSESQQKAELYGRLGWTQFEKGNYSKCIEFSNKANNLFELGWVLANKGLAQLMLNQEVAAMETYINAITLIKKQPKTQYIFNELIKDIKNALRIKPNLAGAEEIKQLIQMQ